MAKIDALFKTLTERKGSDLHLKQGQKPRIRVHGHLATVEEEAELTADVMKAMLSEISGQSGWDTYERTGDLDFAYALASGERFRANFFKHISGYGAIFRMIPFEILTLGDLGMPDTLKKMTTLRSGLILVTGPTGSGKSTTLAAMIHHINSSERRKIITIEEPVEFMHQNKLCMITHREVGMDTRSFSEGLRGAIKSDVDIILVGEMRDRETIELALTAAEMGILVFGTLHTNSAAKTIDRIIDAFPANAKNKIRAILANTLQGVVAQQLVRSTDGSRRHAAYEILLQTPAMRPTIMNGETQRLTSEIEISSQKGMISMDSCLQQLVSSGKITREEAYLKAIDKARFM